MARLPDTTGTLSPEAQKAHDAGLPEEIVEQVRGRGDVSGLPARYAAAARVAQHVLAHESIPQPLADKVGKELGVPEGQRAPF